MTKPVHDATRVVRERSTLADFDLAIVLGSGFRFDHPDFNLLATIPYPDLPDFPATTVSGHSGRLLCGTIAERRLLVFEGRFHLYEGHSPWQATTGIRLAAALGCRQLLLTSAVGGIAPDYRTGDYVWINDHINLSGGNPLTGVRENRFVDLSALYCQAVYPQLARRLQKEGVRLHTGVLAVMSGPSYETPAEIRMLRTLGADMVGMSVAPEAIMAAYCGIQVRAVSRVTNPAAGLGAATIAHDEVLRVAADSRHSDALLFRQLLEVI